jgi:uncharacterized protein DUF433
MSSLPEPLITVSPEYLSGAPVFTGTRVPVQALFDTSAAPLRPAICRYRATSKKQRLPDLLPLVPALLQILHEVKPGEVREIGG